MWNFAEIYGALNRSHGAAPVADATRLAEKIAMLLTDANARRASAEAALRTVEGMAGARARTLAAMKPFTS